MKRTEWISSLGIALALAVAAQVASAQPLARAATNWEGVTVELTAVERKGSVLTVRWTVRNAGTQRVQVQFAYTGRQVTTYVVDEENGTKYYVLTDKEGNSLASQHTWLATDTHGVKEQIEPGTAKRYWAKFPAPPPEVTAVSVFFSEADPLEDVPIADQ